jgi:hypothetical protein
MTVRRILVTLAWPQYFKNWINFTLALGAYLVRDRIPKIILDNLLASSQWCYFGNWIDFTLELVAYLVKLMTVKIYNLIQ